MATRSVLLVSYHFPPQGGSGVQRALKLAKYLPRSGWRAEVLTAAHRHFPLMDEELGNDVGTSMGVHRVAGFEPGGVAARLGRCISPRGGSDDRAPSWEDRIYWRLERLASRMRLPETILGWIPSARSAARRIIQSRSIECVVTTSPPHGAHYIGRALRRRPGIPWIADLRDPLSDNFAQKDARFWSRRYLERIEAFVLKEADRVVVTCPELRDVLIRRYGDDAARRMVVIPNGFDPSDAPSANRGDESHCVTHVDASDRPFRLAHVGAFYRQQSIEPLLVALRDLLAERPELRHRIELRVVGSISQEQRRHVRAEDDTFLRVTGYVPHLTAVREIASADALVLTTPATPGGRLCIPAKTYEYLAFGGHILAFVHHDTGAARLLREAGGATLLDTGDAPSWKKAIARGYEQWRSGALQKDHRPDVVMRFRRDGLAARYADLLNGCLGGSTLLRGAEKDFFAMEVA